MEKRLKRVQRWIDRCVEACKCKAWNSAIAELECARAELDSASREIWQAAAETETRPETRWLRSSKGVLLHVVPISMIILLLAVGSTSMESFSPQRFAAPQPRPSVEWVTADEKVLLDHLRESLSQNPAHGKNAPEAGVERVAVGRSPSKDRPMVQAGPVEGPASNISGILPQRGLSVAAEDLLSLIQVGQRALRTDGESLKVERP